MYHGVTLKILGREINPGGKAVRPGEAGGGEEERQERGRRWGSGFCLSSWWGWQRSGGSPGVGVARSNPASSFWIHQHSVTVRVLGICYRVGLAVCTRDALCLERALGLRGHFSLKAAQF